MKDVSIHASAICESQSIGSGTQIAAFSYVAAGARIGNNVTICENVTVQDEVVVGDNVTVSSGVQLSKGLRVEADVVIGPNATFCSDKVSSTDTDGTTPLQTVLERGCTIGANSTILHGVKIGKDAMIGAGAVVTIDVPSNATVVGNPARIVGYVSAQTQKFEGAGAQRLSDGLGADIGSRVDLGVGNAYIERLPYFTDMRGSLTPLQNQSGLPFVPNRVFLVYGVSNDRVRGEHAHHECEQFLIAANGSLSVVLDDGQRRAEVRLTDQTIGLYLPPMVWGIQYKFSPDTVLMVLASHEYDADDYIRNYDQFTDLTGPAA